MAPGDLSRVQDGAASRSRYRRHCRMGTPGPASVPVGSNATSSMESSSLSGVTKPQIRSGL